MKDSQLKNISVPCGNKIEIPQPVWERIFVSPAVSRGDTKGSLLRRLSVCLSCLSRYSRHTSSFFNNSSSTYTIEMKLHI